MGGVPVGGEAGSEPVGGSSPMAGSGGDMPQAGSGGQVDDGDCMTPPPQPELIGWASEGGGTTGGGDATPTVVTSAQEFSQAIDGNDARVIYVNGSLSTSGRFEFGSNKTVVGVCGAELRGSLHISGVQNIIIRNIRMVGKNCSDSPSNCSAGDDAISVRSSQHLWFDHMEIFDGSDGNLDMTNNSDYITISWTKFYYSTARTDPEQGASGHRFSNLIAGSDSDSGEYRITFHHDWWADNVDQRMPRSRFGDIHVFNNLFTSSGNSYCTNAGYQARVLVENNIYRGVNKPLSPDANGDMHAEGNVFDGTTGNTSDNGGSGFTPPYDYELDPTDGLDQVLMAQVGPQD